MTSKNNSTDKNTIEEIIYDYISNNEKIRNLIKNIASEEIDNYIVYDYQKGSWRITHK